MQWLHRLSTGLNVTESTSCGWVRYILCRESKGRLLAYWGRGGGMAPLPASLLPLKSAYAPRLDPPMAYGLQCFDDIGWISEWSGLAWSRPTCRPNWGKIACGIIGLVVDVLKVAGWMSFLFKDSEDENLLQNGTFVTLLPVAFFRIDTDLSPVSAMFNSYEL